MSFSFPFPFSSRLVDGMMLTGDREGSVKGQKALVEKDEENGDGKEEAKSAAG